MIIEGICMNHHKDFYSDDNNNYNNNNDINITPLLLMYFKFFHRTMAVLIKKIRYYLCLKIVE